MNMALPKKKDVINCIFVVILSLVAFKDIFIPFTIGFIEKRETINKKKIFLYLFSVTLTIFRFSISTALNYLLLVVVIYIIFEVLSALNIKNLRLETNIIFFSTFTVFALWQMFNGFLFYDLIMTLIVALLTTISFIAFKSLDFNLEALNEKDFLILIALTGIFLVTLKDITIYSLMVRNILAVYVILSLAYAKGVKHTVLGGLIIGTISELAKASMGSFIISLTLGGFIAALFNKKGKMPLVAGFMFGSTFLSCYITGYTGIISKFAEIFIAGVLFMITSRKVSEVCSIIEPDRLMLAGGIDNLAGFGEAPKTLYSISEFIEDFKCEEAENADVFTIVQKKVCKKCELKNKCWEENYNETVEWIFDIVEGDTESEGEKMNEFCQNRNEIVATVCERYSGYRQDKRGISFDEFKKSMATQIKGISKYLENISDRSKTQGFRNIEERIVKGFEEVNIPIDKAYINLNDEEYEVELKGNKNILQKNIGQSNAVLSKILNKRMVNISSTGDSFRRTENFKVEIGIATNCATGQDVSGDTYRLIDFLEDKYIMVLSDGMGVGREAKYISSMLTEMFLDMSKKNIDGQTITSLIGSFAKYISNSEKIITLDSTMINLVTGHCELIKIGGAPTFIIKKDSVDVICAGTLPMGIFEEVDFYKDIRVLEEGDIVVSVTDGVIDSKRDIINREFWVSGFLKSLYIDKPQVIAEELLNKTIENYKGNILDDITIIVQKIV